MLFAMSACNCHTCCSGTCLLITLCALQLILTVEHQVFCFLGYLWAGIVGNFVHIIMVIIGLFGVCQYRTKAVLAYAVWLLIWVAISIFVICLYLKIGPLKKFDGIQVLSIGTRSQSWWVEHGIGCGTPRGCLLEWQYVEIIHTGMQCLLSIVCFIVSCYLVYVFMEEDESAQPVSDELEYIKMRYKSPSRTLNYRDPTARQFDSMPRSNASDFNSYTLNTTIDAATLDRHSRANEHYRPTMLQQLHGNATSERDRRSNSDKYSQKSSSGKQDDTRSQRSTERQQQRLPWVHVAPSVTAESPQIIDNDPGPPSYFQIQMTQDARYRDYRRDKDSMII